MTDLPDQMLTAGEVARWLALGEGWVREHAAELGAVKLGSDPRAPLRFTRRAVENWVDGHQLRPPMTQRRRRIPAERVKLLPLPRERR